MLWINIATLVVVIGLYAEVRATYKHLHSLIILSATQPDTLRDAVRRKRILEGKE